MIHLLDTNIVLWALNNDPRTPTELMEQLSAFGAVFAIHQVTIWESQIKFSSGKLELPGPPEQVFESIFSSSETKLLRLENETIYETKNLKPIHKDPFDRILASHCLLHDLPLVTSDHVFLDYGVNAIIAN